MAETEKSLGKKILGFFINEANAPVGPATPSARSEKAAVGGQAPPPIRASGTEAAGEIDSKFVEHFAQLLEKANLPGLDYFEYKQALKSVEGLGLSEEKQFQASWASFRAMAGGLSDTSVLTTSANQYLQALNNDRAHFHKDVEKAIQDRVGNLSNESRRLQEDNKAFAEQIVALQKKIDANNARLEAIAGEVREQSEKINANKENFERTYLMMTDQINSDLIKIKNYLT